MKKVIYALHGMMGDCRDWDCLDLDLLAVDLWENDSAADFEAWSDVFNRNVKASEGKYLMGYSMGGRLALHALLDQASCWKAGVMISTHPGLQNEEDRRLRVVADRQWASGAREMLWADFLKLWNGQAVLRSEVASRHQAELEPMREKIAAAFEHWSLGQQKDLRPALQQCQTPVLWITGERDEKFTQLAAEVVADNDGFEHVIIPDAGHRLLFETGEALKRLKIAIGDFQKRIV